jgi:hypothetical protein
MKKVTLTVPWGHYNPTVKKTRIKTQFITMLFFPPNNISQHRFVLKYRQTDRHDFVLGNFEYIEADREIYRKCITRRKQYTRSKKALLTHRCYANWIASTIFRSNACSTFF